jgi:glycosyltransferase involved in cell wall biosynthesis
VWHKIKNRLFDGFFTTGSRGADALRVSGVEASRIATGLYPIDTKWWRSGLNAFQAESSRLRAGLGKGPVFVAVCKMSERENPLLIIDAFAALYSSCPTARLLFVGDGPLRRAVEDRISLRAVGDAVALAGYVDYYRLPAYYGAADVFVHLPRQEPWGISVGEAIACGLAVVASTSVGAAADLVLPGRTGKIVHGEDPDELAAALCETAGLRELDSFGDDINAMSLRCSVDSSAQELEALVERLSLPSRA